MNETELRRFFERKRVALTGPSCSIESSGLGPEIDDCDLVVRMNHQWPIPPELRQDVGKRMDVLYHCCNPDYRIERLFDESFSRTQLIFYERGAQTETILRYCTKAGISAVDVTSVYDTLRTRLGTFPNTGLVAVTHLLSFPVAELRLYGLSFFREPYYSGYPGDGAAPEIWSGKELPVRIWEHDLERQFLYFTNLHRADKRLLIDPRTRPLFGKDTASDSRYDSALRGSA